MVGLSAENLIEDPKKSTLEIGENEDVMMRGSGSKFMQKSSFLPSVGKQVHINLNSSFTKKKHSARA